MLKVARFPKRFIFRVVNQDKLTNRGLGNKRGRAGVPYIAAPYDRHRRDL